MSVNVTELLGKRVRAWVVSHLADGEAQTVADPFWVVPVEESDPSYPDLCKEGLGRLKGTEILGSLVHESLVFNTLKDGETYKLCIGNKNVSPSVWRISGKGDDFTEGELDFLQLAHLVTRNELPAAKPVPSALVKALPIFEDDVIGYFPSICVLNVSGAALSDTIEVLALKALLELEATSNHVETLRELILNVGYAIPGAGHEWIFGQLFSAVRAQRLINFYLEIYKLFEFFFPLQSIFDLADRLEYTKSELVLLGFCRNTLSWNVNHQRGARAAAGYATTAFAEVCLGEIFSGAEGQAASFKERAVEKLTTARHELTHQDFRAVSILEKDLLRLSEGLLVFLRDAFVEYGVKLDNRQRQLTAVGRRRTRARAN